MRDRINKIDKMGKHCVSTVHHNTWMWGKTIEPVFDQGDGKVTLEVQDGYCNIYISGLSVVEGKRHQGLGTYIMTVAEEMAREWNKEHKDDYRDVLALEVETSHPELVEWYKRLGFSIKSTFNDSTGRELHYMTKTI